MNHKSWCESNQIYYFHKMKQIYRFSLLTPPSLSDRDVCHIEKAQPPPTSNAPAFLPSHPWTLKFFFFFRLMFYLPSSAVVCNPIGIQIPLPRLRPHLLIQTPSLSSSLSSPSFSFSPLILLFLSPPPHCTACISLCPSFHSLRYELCATSLPHERIILPNE